MSPLNVVPESVASAAQDIAGIGSALTQAHAEAAPATTAILTAAQDEVSASIAALFSEHGQAFQSLSAQAARFHEQFVQTLGGAGGAYAATEAASTPQFDLCSLIPAFQIPLGAHPTNLNSVTGLASNDVGGVIGLISSDVAALSHGPTNLNSVAGVVSNDVGGVIGLISSDVAALSHGPTNLNSVAGVVSNDVGGVIGLISSDVAALSHGPTNLNSVTGVVSNDVGGVIGLIN